MKEIRCLLAKAVDISDPEEAIQAQMMIVLLLSFPLLSVFAVGAFAGLAFSIASAFTG